CASASATEPTDVTMKPRCSSARAMRLRKAASSSAISSVRSLFDVALAMAGDTGRLAPGSWLMAAPSTWALCSLEDRGWPAHGDRGATPRPAVAEAYGSARPLQQGLGDEHTQPHVALLALAGRDEGGAEFVQKRLREARTVVRNLDLRPFGCPVGGDLDL